MNEVIAFVGSYLAGKGIDSTLGLLKSQVVEKWTNYRVNRFFTSFLSVFDENPETALNHLTEALKDEYQSENVYNALRSACFTRSKEYAPKIIGLLAGKVLNENRTPTEFETNFYEFCEVAFDDDFEDLIEFLKENSKRFSINSSNEYELLVFEDSTTSNYGDKSTISLNPINLSVFLGRWAVKCESFNLLRIETIETNTKYYEDSERYIDEDGIERKITTNLIVPNEFLELSNLLSLVVGEG